MIIHNIVNPEMITLARRSRGKSQVELAALVGVTNAVMSRYEAGIRKIDDSNLAKIVAVLDYPRHFFMQQPWLEGPGIGETFHRKRQNLTSAKLKQAYALAEIRRLEIAKLLESWDALEPSVPEYPVDLFDDKPEKIARSVRAYMQIPEGPVFNMTRTLEQAGCVVVSHDFGTRLIDGFSHRPRTQPPFFHMNSSLPPDRWRWTLAHELGHVVMHFNPMESPKLVEQQADQFAGEFLAPGHELRPMLHDLSFQRLGGLKLYWKISMQSLIMRAYHLGTITDKQRRSMFVRLSKEGYRTREPDTLAPPVEPPEKPFRLARYHMTRLEYTRETLMELLAIGETDFQEYYHDPKDVLPGLGSDHEGESDGFS